MTKIIFALLALGVLGVSAPAAAKAAEGSIVYETAISSICIKTVTLSTSTAVLVSRTKAQSLRGDGKYISWYSSTLFNVNSSTAAYAYSASATAAPVEATCTLGLPLGGGTAAAPWNQTEQFMGDNLFMWAIACGSASMDIKVEHRGR